MKTKTFRTMGAVHPILFFIVIYAVTLLFSIFICSSLFYGCKSNATAIEEQKMPKQKKEPATPIAARVMQ